MYVCVYKLSRIIYIHTHTQTEELPKSRDCSIDIYVSIFKHFYIVSKTDQFLCVPESADQLPIFAWSSHILYFKERWQSTASSRILVIILTPLCVPPKKTSEHTSQGTPTAK